MRKTVLAAMALACVLVPQASAKGPIVLCGPAACAPLGSGTETAVRWWPSADGSHVTPIAPAPFFKLRFTEHESDALAFWVPSAGVMRTVQQGGGAVWFRPAADDAAILTQAAAGLRPFAAPTRVSVTVNFRTVPRGAWGYLRLFAMGTPVAAVPTRRWLPVDTWGAETPWTRCFACLWVSRTGAYLRRADGDLLRIPDRVAERVRHRLPLR